MKVTFFMFDVWYDWSFLILYSCGIYNKRRARAKSMHRYGR